MKTNYIFKEVSEPNFSFYFDCDCFSEKSGGYEYNLFIIHNENVHSYGLNYKEYKLLTDRITDLVNAFEEVENNPKEYTYKEAMQDCKISYNPTKCHKLKEWYKNIRYIEDIETARDFLTITTGKVWESSYVTGYCQGDYVDMLYCKEIYNDPTMYGELYLGCGREFSLTETDENGQEDENTTVYGYYVADCQYRNDEELKTVLCNMEGIKPEETKVFTISNTYTTTHYDYVEV